jgi:hypothetical protein
VKCSDFLKELTDFLEGTIDPSVKAELQEHLHWCHNCEVVLNTTSRTIQIYRQNKVYDLPDPLRDKLQSAIMSKCRKSKEQA